MVPSESEKRTKSLDNNYRFSFLSWPGERIQFSIKEGNEAGLFSVDSSSGLLSLLRPLDYEEQDQVRTADVDFFLNFLLPILFW